MGCKWNCLSAISCQMWPHSWWNRAPLGCEWGWEGWMWLKETSSYLGRVSTISWAGKDKGGEAVWGHSAPRSPLQPSDSCGLHLDTQVSHGLQQSLAWAAQDEQKSPQAFKEALGCCSAWVTCPGPAARGEEGRRAGGEMESAEVVFGMTCPRPSVAAPAGSVTACTHIVDSRASPGQEGGDPLTSPGCLNTIPLEQAEQEEIKGSTRMGTAQLPAFSPDDCEKSLAVEVAVSAGRALDQEHFLTPLGCPPPCRSWSACRSCSSWLLPCSGYLTENFKESFSSFLFIHWAYFARANLYLSSSVCEGPHKAAQPPEKLICALHLLSLITEGKQWRCSHGSARAPLPIQELIKYVSCI